MTGWRFDQFSIPGNIKIAVSLVVSLHQQITIICETFYLIEIKNSVPNIDFGQDTLEGINGLETTSQRILVLTNHPYSTTFNFFSNLDINHCFTQITVLVYFGFALSWIPCETHVMEFPVGNDQARSIQNKKTLSVTMTQGLRIFVRPVLLYLDRLITDINRFGYKQIRI